MSQITIRKATMEDLSAIKSLADAHRHELGFVLRSALARSIERGEIFVAENGAGPLGFVEYHHRRDGQTTLYHIAVDPAYRRRGIGRALVRALAAEAAARGQRVIYLKCPINLIANSFYADLGFQPRRVEPAKRRPLNVWMLEVKLGVNRGPKE